MPATDRDAPGDRSARDRAILAAAAAAFYERGFHGVGVDEIGRRAGLSGPSLYRHFAGKDELLATLLNEAMDELLGATVPVHADPERDLLRALRHHVGFALENRHLVSLYQREVRVLAEPWGRAFARRRSRYTQRWEDLVAQRFPDLSPTRVATTAQAALGLIFSVAAWPAHALAVEGPEELEDVVMAAVSGLLSALSGSPTSPPRSGGTAARRSPR